MATVPIVTQKAPIAAPFDCGICNIDHACHCPRMKAYCDTCIPPTPAAVRNVVARTLSESEDQYLPVAGLTLKGVAHATAYHRRQNLRAVAS